MITKGFDFEGVSLVGVLNADNLLLNPDFRASERAFQLLQQVAGRAGRRHAGGEVVIQTSDPANPLLRQVLNDDFRGMAHEQLADRQSYFYPPYARLTLLTLKHTDVQIVRRAASELAVALRRRFGTRLLGPIAPAVDRIRGEYLMQLLLKVESSASRLRANELVKEEVDKLLTNKEFKQVTVAINVDPQ